MFREWTDQIIWYYFDSKTVTIPLVLVPWFPQLPVNDTSKDQNKLIFILIVLLLRPKTYGSKNSDSRSWLLHLLNHSTWIPHVRSNLLTNVLVFWKLNQSSDSWSIHKCIRAKSCSVFVDCLYLVKGMELSFNSSCTSCDLCSSLPFVHSLVSEHTHPTQQRPKIAFTMKQVGHWIKTFY